MATANASRPATPRRVAAVRSARRHEGARITVRRPEFDFSDTPKYWFLDNAFLTRYMDGMAALFPDGEMFFVNSVRAVRDEVTDEALQKEISAFIGQEAMHAKAHREFDAYLAQTGLPIHDCEQVAVRLLGLVKPLKSKKLELAITAALEHFTATWAQRLLTHQPSRDRMLAPEMRRLFTWHAIEESEHKTVAFDVYKAVGGGYPMRAGAMVGAMVILPAALAYIELKLLRHDRQLFNVKGWAKGLWYLFGPTGFFPPTIPVLFDYFRPDFHPDDHDAGEAFEARKRELKLDEMAVAQGA
ncbi:MAG: metal-dependent hydrolase [Nevskiaceae bacterium]|nr:MAG: metal-dependent hydrolase [Nevskiaceae bacterium]TBR74299.1 MAG: metal-dependent hydrolase [Nevskiaceae bacterium]